MAELWPSTLPRCMIPSSVSWQVGDGRLRTPVEAGPAKQRRRTSAVSDRLSGQMKMTKEQWADLKDFVSVTLQGSDPFLFADPDGGGSTGDDMLVRFADSMPKAERLGRSYWLVTLDLEVLPQ